MIEVRALLKDDLEERLDDVAALRIAVFRDWPYLYDGDTEYERNYLQAYIESTQSTVIGAFDGDWMVGAATGAPLTDHAADFAQGFVGTDVDISTTYYCGESVLLDSYRGRGIGHRFFDRREEHAQGLGFKHICFCAVVRPEDHPDRPEAPRSLEPFWRGRGYVPLEGVKAGFAWRDLGQPRQTEKKMQFWMRPL